MGFHEQLKQLLRHAKIIGLMRAAVMAQEIAGEIVRVNDRTEQVSSGQVAVLELLIKQITAAINEMEGSSLAETSEGKTEPGRGEGAESRSSLLAPQE